MRQADITPSRLCKRFVQGVVVRKTAQGQETTEIALTDVHASELGRATKVRPGFCVDTAMPTSVVGLAGIWHVCSVLRRKFSLRPSTKSS